jgi:hypothetical protein
VAAYAVALGVGPGAAGGEGEYEGQDPETASLAEWAGLMLSSDLLHVMEGVGETLPALNHGMAMIRQKLMGVSSGNGLRS